MSVVDDVLARGAPPFIAILRGLQPQEASEIGNALVGEGVRLIEVPLNSPDPFASIAALQQQLGDQALIGAGTVLTPGDVDRLVATGASLMVTPHTDPDLINRGIDAGLAVMPGFLTPSEALAAGRAGARHLKLFPASTAGLNHLRAIREILPASLRIWAVGGVTPDDARSWIASGATGVAAGGTLFRPGKSASEVAKSAAAYIAALRK